MYCWTYANEWYKIQQERLPEFENNNIDGPWFVSIGNSEKLLKFLELNPNIPSDRIFVDDYNSLETYKSIGFENFSNIDTKVLKTVKIRIPKLNFNSWIKYVMNVPTIAPLSPTESIFKTGLPEGGLKNGGTFVVKGDDVIYQWYDRIPGDYPSINDIIEIAKAK